MDLRTYRLLNRYVHFENRNGGVYLNVERRKRFHRFCERQAGCDITSEKR